MVRVKSRYLLCEVNVSDRSRLLLLDDRAVATAVRAAVARTHGDYGSALCTIGFSEEKQQVRKAILNCSLPGGNKEAFEDELEIEEDEEE
ncbi:hypothetical protein F2P81_013732 [Scophthalmus maximus]|uniref:Uncharacterized protein n=1 Tax=Scophthalmus maximus TaxID=52904 RepID=A0A6A4SEU7_SCOMX|nr:hypothetical protein F2P81_013732 [Scophthalmus maximus]